MRNTVCWTLLGAAMVAGLTQALLASPKESPSCASAHGCAGSYNPIPADSQEAGAPRRLAEAATKSSAQQQCDVVRIEVTAYSETEASLACSAAGDALELLGRCNIHPRSRVSVHILGQALHPRKELTFGLFDRQKAIVSNLSSATALAAGTAYMLLPAATFYRSLVVHEIVHAVMHQNYERHPTNYAAYEYPSYALQILSLAAADRDKLLQAIHGGANPPGLVFNDILLAMDPLVFAASAYEHFTAAPDACRQLNALLKGDVDFIPTLPPWL